MKKIVDCVLFFLLFIWQLPQNIVALVLMLYWKKKRMYHIGSYKYCHAYCVNKFDAGISLGNFCFVGWFYDVEAEDVGEPYLAHELIGHTFQSRLLGPLYLIVIGIPSFIHAQLCKDNTKYYDFYTERWANKIAGICFDPQAGLVFKEWKIKNSQ